MKITYNKKLKPYAKNLRNNLTDAEQLLTAIEDVLERIFNYLSKY